MCDGALLVVDVLIEAHCHPRETQTSVATRAALLRGQTILYPPRRRPRDRSRYCTPRSSAPVLCPPAFLQIWRMSGDSAHFGVRYAPLHHRKECPPANVKRTISQKKKKNTARTIEGAAYLLQLQRNPILPHDIGLLGEVQRLEIASGGIRRREHFLLAAPKRIRSGLSEGRARGAFLQCQVLLAFDACSPSE